MAHFIFQDYTIYCINKTYYVFIIFVIFNVTNIIYKIYKFIYRYETQIEIFHIIVYI